MSFLFGKLVRVSGPDVDIEVDYPIYQIEKRIITLPESKAKMRMTHRLYPEDEQFVLMEVEDGYRPRMVDDSDDTSSIKQITQTELRRIMPDRCPECGGAEMRIFANTVMSGASLEFDAEGDLVFDKESDDAIADLAWGYGCLDCGFTHYFPHELQIDWRT